jgi:hypothetical protein
MIAATLHNSKKEALPPIDGASFLQSCNNEYCYFLEFLKSAKHLPLSGLKRRIDKL